MRKTLYALAAFVAVTAAGKAIAATPDLDTAKAVIDAHSGIPEFTAPGPSFDAKTCMAGKRLLSIPTSSAIPFVDGIETSMAKVAKDVGFTFQQWKNQGQPTQWVQGMDFAVNNKFDAVDLFAGIIPGSLAPQVAAANKAGLKVLASHYSDTSEPSDPAVAVTLKLPFHEVGEVIADWITLKTGGKANVLIIGSDDILATKPYVKTLTDTLDKVCGPGCKHRYVGVTVPEWSTKVQTSAQSALIADPTIDYIVPIYDSMAQFVLPALTITGHRKDVKIATFNGTPFILDMVRKGDVEMDVGESLGWIARATLDGYMRGLCGLPTGDKLNVPLYIFDEKNVKSAGVPADFDQGYGDKHIGGFDKLWGLGNVEAGAPPLPRRYPGEAPAISIRHLSKRFGSSLVLDDVALDVMPGEVHGLLGQNGSGKSTLIKILAGFHDPEPGSEFLMHGEQVGLPMPPGAARRNGLAFVHQHLGLVPSLTVLENLLIGTIAGENRWRVAWAREARAARATFERFSLAIDPMARIADLPQVERALVAIVRAFEDIRLNAEGGRGVLVLDEPTPFLPRLGVDQLFGLVRSIVKEGAAVIFVSHDIDEIREITDRATVLRDGQLAGTVVSKEANADQFVELIIGRRVNLHKAAVKDLSGAPVALAARNVSGAIVRDVSLDIRRGEILGLTGLIGSGFDELPYLIYGARRASAGTMTVAGRSLPLTRMSPPAALDAKLVLLPSDRLGAAGVGTLSVADNMLLPVLHEFRRWFGLDWPGIERRAGELGRTHDVRPNVPGLALASLSGGNAQKVLLAKWLQTEPVLLMLDEPTQGVDVGARQQLFSALDFAAAQGTALLVASTDAEQLAQICDRVLVFGRGRVVAELQGAAISKDAIAELCLRSFALTPTPEAEAA